MPRKLRELKAELRRAGFRELRQRGKGSHTVWKHPALPGTTVILAGTDGRDADRYQERDVATALVALARRQEGR